MVELVITLIIVAAVLLPLVIILLYRVFNPRKTPLIQAYSNWSQIRSTRVSADAADSDSCSAEFVGRSAVSGESSGLCMAEPNTDWAGPSRNSPDILAQPSEVAS